MKYGSVCSGIEAATVAWHPLGWKPSFFSEIDKFPREVLAHHYPDTPLHGDFTTIQKGDYEPIELLVGGTPCQSFSVAGLRAGLNDPRGNLMLEFGALAERLQSKWLLWENVPGVLSSNGGRDFGSFLAMLAELRYGFAYRVLDAQYFGVPQRRRRVFVVGCLGDWRSAAAVLFERHSLQGHPAPRREKRQEVTEIAGTLTSNGGGLNRPAGNANELDFCIASYTPSSFANYSEGVGTLKANGGDLGGGSENLVTWPADIAPTLNASFASKQGLENQHINGGGDCSYQVAKCLTSRGAGGQNQDPETANFIPMHGGHFDKVYSLAGNTISRKPENGGNGTGYDESGVSYTLTKTDQYAVAIPINTMTMMGRPSDDLNPRMGLGVGNDGEPQNTLTKAHSHAVAHSYGGDMQVRRLTPKECERLQGFPDDFTNIPGASDSARYKALGNSFAVPVVRWLGERIEKVERISRGES